MSLVKEKREEAGLTMSEVARRAEMRLTKLWKIEHGELRLLVAS
jgi:transcriptional regulator with XRE-family HTH domain